MDIGTSWRRKRPKEDEEEYLASKRYISEKFFNMRISHPAIPRMHGAGVGQVAVGEAAAEIESNTMSDEESLPARTSLKPTATCFDNDGGLTDPNFLDEDDADIAEASTASRAEAGAAGAAAAGAAAAASASGGPPTPHPFVRSASSAVDEKLDDWVRTSRHRMLADASVNSAPDLCRALILYKPVTALAASASGGAAPAEGGGGPASADSDDDDGEGGGDPTPSPQSGGDGGGETAPSAAAAAELRVMAAEFRAMAARGLESISTQSAGSSTAEATGFTGGGKRTTGQSHVYVNGVMNDHAHDRHHHHRVAGSLFGRLPRGLCTAESGGDDAGGTTLLRDETSAAMLMAGEDGGAMMTTRDDGDVGRGRAPVPASVDAMDIDAAGDEGAGRAGGARGLASLESRLSGPPVLTREGTSRGAPTLGLTAENVLSARTATQRTSQGRGQHSDHVAGGSSSARPPLTAQAWAHW